jgi:hypothetical protein
MVIPESSKSTENSIKSLSEVISTFDVIEDFASSSHLFMKRDESLMPADAVVEVIDPTFDDGDGIEALIDFGSLGLEPHGLLCKDNKYRAGIIRLQLDKPYSEVDAKLTLTFDEKSPFYSGDGSEMCEFKGSILISRVSEKELKLHCGELILTLEDENPVTIIADLSITCISDSGVGIVDDELDFDGKLEINTPDEKLTLSIIEPLQKDYELSCAQYIKAGIIDVKLEKSISEIAIDFDPDGDNTCDQTVGITVNGRAFRYSY